MRTRTFKETYSESIRLLPETRSWGWYALLIAVLLLLPWMAPLFIIGYITLILIATVGAIGLNLVTGTAGLVSLGHAGFLAIGAYVAAIAITDHGWGILPAMVAAGLVAAIASLIIGIPSLRLRGLYLAITTLAFSIIVTQLIVELSWLTGGSSGKSVGRPPMLGIPMRSATSIYYLCLVTAMLAALAALNLLRSRVGRAWAAIRDYDIAASLMGVNLRRYKLLAFAVSAFFTGIAGSLLALHIRYLNVDSFTLLASIEAIAMIIVGGLGSVRGAILGAIVITLLPDLSRYLLSGMGEMFSRASSINAAEVRGIIYAGIIMAFLRYEPDGLAARWSHIKRFWIDWPFSRR